jgi:hypothetical protein
LDEQRPELWAEQVHDAQERLQVALGTSKGLLVGNGLGELCREDESLGRPTTRYD